MDVDAGSALDKPPVNLHALQTCNVGKFMNHLRGHKNSDIQKKAKSLVGTWKRRVEPEMNLDDAKSGSSRHGKQRQCLLKVLIRDPLGPGPLKI